MANIPRQIASRSLDTGSVVSYPSGSPIGSAIEGLGNSIQNVAERFRQKQDQKDNFDATIRENEMLADIARQEDDAVRNAPIDGAGIHDSVYGEIDPVTQQPVRPGSYDTLFDSYMQRMPESKRAEFAQKRELYRMKGSARLAGQQYSSEQAYYKVEIQKTQNEITTQMAMGDPNDTATFDAFKQQGLDIIDRSGLPALEKDVARANWQANADETLFKTLLAKDPEFAGKAKAALGLAPSDASTNPVGSVVDRIIGAESSGNPNAQNSRSSAGGLGGFIDSTWVATVKKFRPDVARGMSNDQIIELKKSDPTLARELTTRHTEENAKGLTDAGIPATAANTYLAHFAGLAGAKNILNAPDDTAVSSVLSDAAIKANPEVLAGKTVGQVKAWAARKMRAGAADVPRFNGDANAFLKTRLQKQHGPDHIDVMSPVMQDRLASMLSNAPDYVRQGVDILSGARSNARQKELWEQSDKTGKWVARPGNSKHEDRGKGGEAADLGWNGGKFASAPKEVRDWIHANAEAYGLSFPMGHEPWHIEVAEARGGNPSADPRFANIPLERRLVLANQADVEMGERQRTEAATIKADYTQHKDALELQIVQGQIRDENLISNDAKLNAGDKATLITKVRTQNEGANQIASDFTALNDRTLALDPYSSKDKTRADNLYSDAVKRIPPEQHGAVAGAILEQTGVVPQPVINSIRQGLSSQSATDVAAALQLAQRISAFDPAALARRDGGSDVQTAVDDFAFDVNKRNLSPAEAAQRHIERSSPEAKFNRKAMEPAAKEFMKEVAETDLSSEFDTWLGSAPDIGFSEAQRLGIQAEFAAIAEDQFYRANGDPAIAKNRAVEEMKRLYGVTEVTGRKVVMKHPPERYWPVSAMGTSSFTGTGTGTPSLDYAHQQLEADLRALNPDFDAGSIQFVTTPETDAMVKRGDLPGYAVLYKDSSGVLQTIPGKLWRPDIDKAKAFDRQQADVLEGRARENRPQRRQQAPYRVQGQDDFLSGNDPAFGDRDASPSPPVERPRGSIPPAIPKADDAPDLETSVGGAM